MCDIVFWGQNINQIQMVRFSNGQALFLNGWALVMGIVVITEIQVLFYLQTIGVF